MLSKNQSAESVEELSSQKFGWNFSFSPILDLQLHSNKQFLRSTGGFSANNLKMQVMDF